ncbi:class I SAM-dependent methyltransferase [Pseudonocardia kujensis]|uniref:class I SAM-dependent methyltransferase n=1 Tax=Pseudonocardia kujensis TaxID=1128675 RepID=UPI001E609BA7|nr:class I SAM-dependent methyltransferase [Pseudonocardia kujensis]MCE0761771.1 class I SAM-dependent methyltransferase [Pseudonocardia kujensis]
MHAEQVTEPVDRERDRAPLRWYVRLVLRYAGRGPYLEAAGDGRLLRRLAEYGPASGVASSPAIAARVRAEAPGCPVLPLAEVPSGSFRCLVAINALGRTDDPERDRSDVREWRRVLVPGGRAVVLVPDAAGRGARLAGEVEADAGSSGRSHADWLRLFADAGLSVHREGSDGLSRGPYGRIPTWLDPRTLPARVQQRFGSLFLNPGEGENSVFVLERPG